MIHLPGQPHCGVRAGLLGGRAHIAALPVVVPAQPLDLLDEAVLAVGKIAAVLQVRARVRERLDEADGVAEADRTPVPELGTTTSHSRRSASRSSCSSTESTLSAFTAGPPHDAR